MKYTKIILLVMMLFSGLVVAQESEKATGPLLIFDTVEHDFGEVGQNQKLEFAFHFTNEGTDTLRVLRVKSS